MKNDKAASENKENYLEETIFLLKRKNRIIMNHLNLLNQRAMELDDIGNYLMEIVTLTISADRISESGLNNLKSYFLYAKKFNLLDVSDILQEKTLLRRSNITELLVLLEEKIQKKIDEKKSTD